MKVNLRYFLALIFFLVISNLVANSQLVKGGDYNPEKLLAESKDLDQKAELALTRAVLYQQEGSIFLDSARLYNNMLKTNLTADNFRLYVRQLESNYTIAYKYIAMADSMAILAENFRELSVSKSKEAYAMMGKDVEVDYNHSNITVQPDANKKNTSNYVTSAEIKKAITPSSFPTVNNDKNQTSTQCTSLFIVQLGAGNMNLNYFSKVPDVKVVNCKDGIKRYILPGNFSKTEAAKKKEELVALGYEQIFIRTKESLDKISK